MPSHHFNGQCCYLFQKIFQSQNSCFITKLFQGVFYLRHDITKRLKLAQNGTVLFYFFKNVLVRFANLSPPLLPPPPSLPQREEHWHSPVTSMLAPPASAYAGLRYRLCLTVEFKTFFPKKLAALLATPVENGH